MKKKQYSSDKYSRQVEKIKKLIRKYDEVAILDGCLNYLYAPAENELERLRRHPWLVLLLLKWTFMNKPTVLYKRESLDNNKLHSILQKVYDLGNLVKMPSEYSHPNLFMRNMAFQQFLFQHHFSIQQYARQALFFKNLPTNHSLQTWFTKKHGITCDEFITLSFALLSRFMSWDKHSINLDWFSPLFGHFGRNKVEKFLDAISIDIRKLQKKLTSFNKSSGGYQEYYEQSPFLNFPFIKHDDEYTLVHPYILYRCLEYFIYDSLKQHNSDKFMNYFGKIFENYLLKGLNYSALSFITEQSIKKYLPGNIKCVDYIIKGNNSNIFIDAKAAEMPYLGKITDDPEIIQQKVKNSVIKAIEQAFELNDFLLNSTNKNSTKFKSRNYLLVVTYKELYLGNGTTFYEAVDQKKIDVIRKKIDPRAVIDLNKIHFVTIDNFDMLMSLQKNHGISIEDVIEKSISNDSSSTTKKFDFYQHIYSMCNNIKMPEYLELEKDNVLNILESYFS